MAKASSLPRAQMEKASSAEKKTVERLCCNSKYKKVEQYGNNCAVK